MLRSGFVPVHNEEGGIKFEYQVTPFDFFGSESFEIGIQGDGDIAAEDTGNAKVQLKTRSDSDAAPDFLGFDDVFTEVGLLFSAIGSIGVNALFLIV